MTNFKWSAPKRGHFPIILIRGFGGLNTEDERSLVYQGFEQGSVYPHKQGENYIYEGMILRFLKSKWQYQDATNVLGYYNSEIKTEPIIPDELKKLPENFFGNDQLVLNPQMALNLLSYNDPCRSLWVFRYYDFEKRKFSFYGEQLVRLIEIIRTLLSLKLNGVKPKVNIIAHSMGGLIVREAIQRAYAKKNEKAADEAINKIVTLGTPHQGVTFQFIRDLDWLPLEANDEIEQFNPDNQKDPKNPTAALNFEKHFPLERLLTVVGTNYRDYNNKLASFKNRLFSVRGEGGLLYNRSDGLIKQTFAQIKGAPRTFIHKSHDGYDSLQTSREVYEIATRFFFGDVKISLRLVQANISEGFDWVGKSEFFHGVSIKPRNVDFYLFYQSKEAENCYGPFAKKDLSDDPDTVAFSWADDNRLLCGGYLNSELSDQKQDIVIRVDFYLGERDFVVGFSDNVILSKQYYLRFILSPTLQVFLQKSPYDSTGGNLMDEVNNGWEFEVEDTGFTGKYRLELAHIHENGE